MPDERKRQTLPPERLREALARLNEVLDEAKRLRSEITRQLETQSFEQQQHLSGARRKAVRTPSRRKRN